MTDYGTNTLLSYNKYLRVRELIELQECLSDPAQHDELLFITIHQAYELWFKIILKEIDAAIQFMDQDRPPAAERALRRIVEVEKLLVNQIHIIETMSPSNFLQFRDQLNPASGFQSMQFREIEFASGLKDEKVLRAFAEDDFAHPRLKARYAQPTLGDAFYALLRRHRIDAPVSNETSEEEPEIAFGKAPCAVLEILTPFEEPYEK